jgi:hypothetical protein
VTGTVVSAAVTEVRWRAEPAAAATNGTHTNGTHTNGTAEGAKSDAPDDAAASSDPPASPGEITVETPPAPKKRRWFFGRGK